MSELKKFDDFMKGGHSNGKPDEEYNQEELKKGAEIQAEEHGGDEEISKKIAKDHIEEFPKYYDDEVGLKNFEKELEEKEKEAEADVEEDLDKTGAEYDKENDEDELIVQDEAFKLFKESLNFDYNTIKNINKNEN
jgi:hypothetical protein